MRIIQTFWTAGQDPLHHPFGWPAAEYNLMSWAMSCISLREHYSDVVLYTDSAVRIAQVSLECEKIKKNSTTGETISCISAPIQASATISFNQGGIGVNPTLNISSFTASF